MKEVQNLNFFDAKIRNAEYLDIPLEELWSKRSDKLLNHNLKKDIQIGQNNGYLREPLSLNDMLNDNSGYRKVMEKIRTFEAKIAKVEADLKAANDKLDADKLKLLEHKQLIEAQKVEKEFNPDYQEEKIDTKNLKASIEKTELLITHLSDDLHIKKLALQKLFDEREGHVLLAKEEAYGRIAEDFQRVGDRIRKEIRNIEIGSLRDAEILFSELDNLGLRTSSLKNNPPIDIYGAMEDYLQNIWACTALWGYFKK